MTYNIRHGRGIDGKVDLGRIAEVIAARDPDVVTLVPALNCESTDEGTAPGPR